MLKDLLYGFWNKHWMGIVLTTFCILFFGKIALNGIEYNEYKARFEIECKNKGGVMVVQKGSRGWPPIACRNPASIIDIDM